MDDREWLAQQFEEHRPHLRAVAYRMLGSLGETDDAVQEAWLRLSRSDAATVANLGGWLTTVVSRVCLDMLRARRARREEYVGSWLPEPIVSVDDEVDPEQEAILADSLGFALLVVLETLTPPERLRVRPARHVRRAVRRDRRDRRPDTGRGAPAREQGEAPRARSRDEPRCRPGASARDRRRVRGGCTLRRLRRAALGARSRGRLPHRRRARPGRPAADYRRARRRPPDSLARAELRAPRPPRARQRHRRVRRGARGQAIRSRRVHGGERTHRGHRHRHRPGQAAPALSRQGRRRSAEFTSASPWRRGRHGV